MDRFIRIVLLFFFLVVLFSCQDPPKDAQQKSIGPSLTVAEANQDLEKFERNVDKHSAFARVTDYDYKAAITALRTKINTTNKPVAVHYLANELSKILGELGDRHAKVRFTGFKEIKHPRIHATFPFPMAYINGKVVKLKQSTSPGRYVLRSAQFKYVKGINGIPIKEFIGKYNPKHNSAPGDAKINKGIFGLRFIGNKLFFTDELDMKKLVVEFEDSNGATKKRTYPLGRKLRLYKSMLEIERDTLIKDMKAGDFENFSKILNGGIGYIRIPDMFDKGEVKGLEKHITDLFKANGDLQNTKALIIDLRNNTGGARYVINLFSQFIVQRAQSPWVGNKGYMRTDGSIDDENKHMVHRFLFPRDYKKYDQADKNAIDLADPKFKQEQELDANKFSKPFYMLLKNGQTPYTRPIYILVNDGTFSAASVFVAVFKDLPNVKVIGTQTDGSSGVSRNLTLNKSGLRITISSLLSLFRGGKPLDGNGTKPDIEVKIGWPNVYGFEDTQLEDTRLKVIEDIE